MILEKLGHTEKTLEVLNSELGEFPVAITICGVRQPHKVI